MAQETLQEDRIAVSVSRYLMLARSRHEDAQSAYISLWRLVRRDWSEFLTAALDRVSETRSLRFLLGYSALAREQLRGELLRPRKLALPDQVFHQSCREVAFSLFRHYHRIDSGERSEWAFKVFWEVANRERRLERQVGRIKVLKPGDDVAGARNEILGNLAADLMNNPEAFRGDSALDHFLRVLIRNKKVDYQRAAIQNKKADLAAETISTSREREDSRFVDLESEIARVKPSASPEDIVLAREKANQERERRQTLREILPKAEDEYVRRYPRRGAIDVQIWRYRVHDGLTWSDVGELVGLTENTTAQRFKRAAVKLQGIITGLLAERRLSPGDVMWKKCDDEDEVL